MNVAHLHLRARRDGVVMLWAIEANEPVTWVMAVMMLITTISTVISAILAYFTGRDKLRFDREMLEMKLTMEACEESRTDCEESRKKDAQRISDLEDRVDRAERMSARLEGENKGALREMEAIRADNIDLRARLFPKRGHPPKTGGK